MLSTKKLDKIHSQGKTIGQWQKTRRKTAVSAISILLVIALMFGGGTLFRSLHGVDTSFFDDTTMTATVAQALAANRFIEAVSIAGWQPSQLAIGNKVNPDIAPSTGGVGSFDPNGVKSVEDEIAILKRGEFEAMAIFSLGQAATGCTDEEMLDPDNWVQAQPLCGYHFTNMTALGKSIRYSDFRVGRPFEIFLAFVAPRSGKIIFIRGGCSNPSIMVPVPDEIIPRPEPTTGTTSTTAPGTTGSTTVPGTTGATSTTAPGTTGSTTVPGTTGATSTTAPAKDPSLDIQNNTSVSRFAVDGDDTTRKTSWDLGGSTGYQPIPREEAEAILQEANRLLQERLAAWQAAQSTAASSGGGVVDSGEEHSAVVSGPGW